MGSDSGVAKRRQITTNVDGGDLSSEGGPMLLRQVKRKVVSGVKLKTHQQWGGARPKIAPSSPLKPSATPSPG